jgi:hypothetical protein
MAVAAKSKGPASDSIMAPEKMRPLLALSKQEPVHAAIGLTADGEGLILLDKKAKPKKVFAMLRSDAAKAKLQLNGSSLRFGRAEVDVDYDPGMVRFFVNKETPGMMRVKLLEVVKRVPYQKVEINIDPSLEDEPEDETEHQEPSAQTAAPAAPPEAPPMPPTAGLDLEALKHELAALIGRIPNAAGSDAARRTSLAGFAAEANNAIKESHAEAAAAAIGRLRTALDTPPVAPPLPAQAPAANLDALHKELARLIGLIPGAAGDDAARKTRLAGLAAAANTQLKAANGLAAEAAVERLRDELEPRGGDPNDPRLAETASDEPPPPPATGMAAWTRARADAMDTLKALEGAIRGMNDPLGDRAIIRLRAIQANLTESPATARQVDELERYVSTDDIIVQAEEPNGFGFEVKLRTPLLAALKSLRDSQGAPP